MEKIHTVFVSSTYEDLKEFRQAAIQAVLRLGHLPIVMENFNSSPYEPKQLISLYLEKSDFFILIVGNCYGSIISDEEISYTEYEYFKAKNLGIPTLVFFADRDLSLPSDKDVATRLGFNNIDDDLRGLKLSDFKSKLLTTRSYFKSSEDLKSLVTSSLSIAMDEFKRPGWTRNYRDSIKKEYVIQVHLIRNKVLPNELENIRDKLFSLNRYLFPASKTTPIRPVPIKSDEYLISYSFIFKAESLYFAEQRRLQFEEIVINFSCFHSCDLKAFEGFENL